MEEKIVSFLYSLFSFYNFYIVFSVILFLFIFEKDRIYNLGGETIYQKLDKNWLKLHIWGKDKTVWQSMEGIRLSLQKATGYAIILLFISVFVPFLNFLGVPIILFIGFNLYFFISYDWVLNHKEEVKNRFSGIVKIIMLSILLTLVIFIIGIYTSDLSFSYTLGQEVPANFKESLYISAFVASIFAVITLTTGAYIVMWAILGVLPISLILIFFILIKLSKNYSFFRGIIFKRLIYINFIVSALIIPLLKI